MCHQDWVVVVVVELLLLLLLVVLISLSPLTGASLWLDGCKAVECNELLAFRQTIAGDDKMLLKPGGHHTARERKEGGGIEKKMR